MFRTVDEQVEMTEGGRPTIGSRLARFAEIAILLLVLVGGLYFAIAYFK